jgi:hypothetical protein
MSKDVSMPIVLFIVALLAALTVAAPSRAADDPASAMTFTLWHSDEGLLFGEGSRDFIFAEGDFVADTADKFEQFLKDNPPNDVHAIVVLNSPGGLVSAGLALGRSIRKHGFWTQVGAALPYNMGVSPSVPKRLVPFLRKPAAPPFPGSCISSCSIAYLGGVYRFMDYGSEYGVHRFYSDETTPDTEAITQELVGEIVSYVAEMGVDPLWIAQMSKGGKTFAEVVHLSMDQMIKLRVVSPRWTTSSAIKVSDDGSYYLAFTTTDPWGTHEIAFGCYRPASGAPQLVATFHLDPGIRAKAEDVAKAVQKYVLQIDDYPIPLGTSVVLVGATADKGRLAATINFPLKWLTFPEITGSGHLGFLFVFDPNAKLPMRLLQFESNFDGAALTKFAAGCK